MRVGNFSVQIPEGRERDSGHVVLDHGTQYRIKLGNHQGRPCDATVTVDGKGLGGFRVYANNYITLERSPEDNGRFTFYQDGSTEGKAAGLGEVSSVEKGLIQVRFVPEKFKDVRPVAVPTSSRLYGKGASQGEPELRVASSEEKTSGGILRGGLGFAPGGTGLSGHSNQSFVTVPDLDGSEDEAVTITIRLVADSGARPLKAVQTRSNTVPDPV